MKDTFDASFEQIMQTAAPSTDNDQLRRFWNEPVNRLVELPAQNLSEGEKERHRIFSLLLILFCTRLARDIYGEEKRAFLALFDESGNPRRDAFAEPDYRPELDALSNLEVSQEARDFCTFTVGRGRRATPHNI